MMTFSKDPVYGANVMVQLVLEDDFGAVGS